MRAHRAVVALAAGAVLSFPEGAATRPKHRVRLRQSHKVIAIASPPEPGPTASSADAARPGTEAIRIFESSYDHEAAGRTREALAALDALPAETRGSYLTTLRRAWLLHLSGREAESWAAYAKARELEASSVEARVGALLPAMALGRWGDVQTVARSALAIEPGNYLANVRLAFATFNLGRFSEAEALYRKLLPRYPSDADVRAGLAWCLAKQGKRPDARREFLQALASAPRSPVIASGLRAVTEEGD